MIPSVAYYDAGACVGTTVQAVNSVLSSLPVKKKLYAFEPFSRSFSRLQKIKSLPTPDLILIRCALGQTPGKIPLYLCHSDQGHSIHDTKGNVNLAAVEMVEVVRLSDVLYRVADAYDINILKLNIEGAELDVITDLYHTGTYKKLTAIIFASSKKGPYPIDLDKIKLTEKQIRRVLAKLVIFQEFGVRIIAYPDPGQFAHAVPEIVGNVVKEKLSR